MDIKIDDISLLSGQPIYSEELGIELYQPTLNDISLMGIEKWEQTLGLFLLDKSKVKLKDVDKIPTFSLIYAFAQMTDEKTGEFTQEKNFEIFLSIIFPQYQILLHQKDKPQFVFLSEEKPCFILGDDNYPIFREYLESMFVRKEKGNENELNIDETDPRAVAMKAKIEDRRRKLAKSRQKAGDKSSLFNIISSFALGANLSLSEVYKMTLYQLYEQFNRLIAKETYKEGLQAMCAGATGVEIKMWYGDI